MKLKNHLVTGGSLVAMLILSGCQSDSYGNNKNPYLLRPHNDLPPVTIKPKEAAPEVDTSPVIDEPVAEEVQGIGGLIVEDIEVTEPIIEEVELVEEPPVLEEPVAEVIEERYYSVVRGDSIWKIATKYGVSQKMLVKENELDPKKPLLIGQKLKLPAGALSDADPMLIEEARNKQRKKSSGSVSERTVSGGTYTVKKGDNLWTIPKRFGVKRSDFLAANNFDKSSVIYVGQKVVVPGKNGSLDNPSSPNTVSESSTYSSDVLPSGNTYVVKKGDNLWTIPKKLKVKRSDFMAVNGFDASTVLQIGQKVKIPGSEAIPEPATSTTQSEESALFTADEKNENLEVPLVPEAANGNEITETVTELPTSEDPSAITKVEPVTSEAPAAELSHNTYTLDVSDGETLESISLIYSTTPEEIMKYNKSIKSNADLKPGDKLTLPFKE